MLHRSSVLLLLGTGHRPSFLHGRLHLARVVHGGGTPQVREQRQRRPLSPHMTVYQPQLTWLMSIGHRVTGATLATAVYAFGLSYAMAAPSTDDLVAWVSSQAPGPLVTTSKAMLAFPLCYHSLNGIRHLVWDCGWALSLRGCYFTGWLVNAGAALGTVLLTFL